MSKKLFINLLWLSSCLFLALPMMAQEKKMPETAPAAMQPPQPLQGEFWTWMHGEWEGMTESPMGKSKDWMACKMGLDNQFIMMHYKSKNTELEPEAAEAMMKAMNLSAADMEKMKNSVYSAMGPMTVNPQSGEIMAWWFDNWRGVYQGKGKMENNKIVMQWEGPMGKSERTIEMASENKLVMRFKGPGPTGEMMEGQTVMHRKAVAEKKY